MILTKSSQRKSPPADKPVVRDPVIAKPAVPLYYVTERGPLRSESGELYCARIFAETILETLESIAILKYGSSGVGHVGCYFPRPARYKNGMEIVPRRWSNHSYGLAIDFKGFVGDDLSMVSLVRMSPQQKEFIREECAAAVKDAGRKPEIIDEGGWLHLGIWP